MKAKKYRYSFCEINQFGTFVVGVLGWPEEVFDQMIWEEYRTHVRRTPGNPVCASFHKDGEKIHQVIYMPDFSGKVPELAALSHECVHACLLTLDMVGQESISTNDHEFLTYMVQFVFQSMLENNKGVYIFKG